jgi:RNA recognition motif-containing protein
MSQVATTAMSLFVGNLPFNLTNEEFQAPFERFGKVSNVTIATEVRYGRRQSRGYGFVDFGDPASLDACLHSGETITLKERVLTYREARPQAVIVDTAFVSGIPDSATNDDLARQFAPYHPTEAQIVHAGSRGRPGFGYAKFASEADRDRAIAALQGSTLLGSPLVVRPASRPFRSADQQAEWQRSRRS